MENHGEQEQEQMEEQKDYQEAPDDFGPPQEQLLRGRMPYTGMDRREAGMLKAWLPGELRAWLRRTGSNAEHANEVLGVSRAQFRRWLNGQACPSEPSMRMLVGHGIGGGAPYEQLREERPWLRGASRRAAPRPSPRPSPRPAPERAAEEGAAAPGPAQDGGQALLDAIAGASGLAPEQRARLSAIAVLMLTGAVEINVRIDARA
jgi:hypothetical protein